MKRVVLIILDSVGVGALPDSSKYGDEASNTIGNIYRKMSNFKLRNFESMGLGNIKGINFVDRVERPKFSFGKMKEMSVGKDTTTGHWEIAGIIMDKPFPVYRDGFPKRIIEKFTKEIGKDVLGNYSSSGTEIIKLLGDEHLETGKPIVYTSADSVFQVAAHEEVISLEKLYKYCEIARKILSGNDAVGRVIARPFSGQKGCYIRTKNRKDFSVDPISETVLDILIENNYLVKSVGKISDIFSKRGISSNVKIKNNMDGVKKTLEIMRDSFEGLIFTNLIDFDMLYGHRNDVKGYANALKEFDYKIEEIVSNLKEDDILIITADHGCDPTIEGTDHTREYVPLFVYSKHAKNGVDLGIRNSFADIAKTICVYFNLKNDLPGKSFISEIF